MITVASAWDSTNRTTNHRLVQVGVDKGESGMERSRRYLSLGLGDVVTSLHCLAPPPMTGSSDEGYAQHWIGDLIHVGYRWADLQCALPHDLDKDRKRPSRDELIISQ